MYFIRGLNNIPKKLKHCVVTIGSFDGLHLGHQSILQQLRELSGQYKVPSLLMSFEPMPIEFMAPAKAKARLMRLREKISQLCQYSIDYFLCLTFNKSFMQLSAEDFVKEILVARLGVKAVVVGDDFRFGCQRQGDVAMLREFAKQYDFEVVIAKRFDFQQRRVSSTWVREALHDGDVALAEKLLGRSYSMQGRVVHGKKLGRQWGFPTANMCVHRHKVPMTGIFVVRVLGLDKVYYGAADLGRRPAVDGDRILLEVFILDFDQDIYGAYLTVEFLHKLRDEEYYSDFDVLRQQIAADVVEAKAYVEQLGSD